ncbi:MAG: hypothetical protein KatS3mg022_1532 [Armatimonadota bacterium]|nr:MAG: hypothetical protein KatS3mg022_1532 [Armatimonadota bacterium]
MKPLRTLWVVALAVVAMSSAHALTFITNRTALGGNDYVDWGVLGATYTVVSNPVSLNSNGGLPLTVSKPTSGSFERLDQGSGWWGNFAQGDHLLWTLYEVGPMVIEFASPVIGAGAQIQRNWYGAFTGTIMAYDAANNLLGSFSLAGLSNGNSDNSAIFLGVLDSSAVIKKVVFDVDNTTGDFAINRLDLVTQGGAPVIPEPGTMLLMSIGGLAIGLGRRFRR